MYTGGCQCGAVRYRLAGDLAQIYVCHCSQCRKQSGSAFGISVPVDPAQFALVQGIPRRFMRQGPSGRMIGNLICPDCGTRLIHELESGMMVLKAGTLDQRFDLSRAIHIYTDDRLPGIVIPDGAKSFAGGPA